MTIRVQPGNGDVHQSRSSLGASPPSDNQYSRVIASSITLWVAFVVVHVWVAYLGLFGPGHAQGDVNRVYSVWVGHALAGDSIVGISTPWVYPILALVPMMLASVAGMEHFTFTWMVIASLVDAVVFSIVIGAWQKNSATQTPRGRSTTKLAAWWWLALLLCLGPVSLGRIDTIAAPIALLGLYYSLKNPRVAGALLAAAAWIKVWPAALIAAALVALHARRKVLVGAVVPSVVIAGIALVLGSGANVLSFVTRQTSRGLQIESPAATSFLWQAIAGVPETGLYNDEDVMTFQIFAPGAEMVANLSTVLLATVASLLVLLGILARRRSLAAPHVLAALALALTMALIVFNKVGSPQFMSWLAAPIAFGLMVDARTFRLPAVLGLVTATLTQAVYPSLYDQLLALDPFAVSLLTVRNLLEFVMFILAVRMLVPTKSRIEQSRALFP